MNAKKILTTVTEYVLDEHNISCDVIALTGDCDTMMKTFLMTAFCEDIETMLNLLYMPCNL